MQVFPIGQVTGSVRHLTAHKDIHAQVRCRTISVGAMLNGIARKAKLATARKMPPTTAANC